jgi:hypothetical protein
MAENTVETVDICRSWTPICPKTRRPRPPLPWWRGCGRRSKASTSVSEASAGHDKAKASPDSGATRGCALRLAICGIAGGYGEARGHVGARAPAAEDRDGDRPADGWAQFWVYAPGACERFLLARYAELRMEREWLAGGAEVFAELCEYLGPRQVRPCTN